MKTTIKKALNITAAIILCGGLVQSLYRAANDYGLREAENVHPAVTAQLDDTSGKETDGGTTDGEVTVYLNKRLQDSKVSKPVTTDSNGKVTVEGIQYTGLLPNTKYTFVITSKVCVQEMNKMCQKDQVGNISLSYHVGWDSTNGDSTNNR